MDNKNFTQIRMVFLNMRPARESSCASYVCVLSFVISKHKIMFCTPNKDRHRRPTINMPSDSVFFVIILIYLFVVFQVCITVKYLEGNNIRNLDVETIDAIKSPNGHK